MFGNLTLNESMEAKPYDEQKNNGHFGRNDIQSIESIEPPKTSYPKRVFLILSNEFCERFTFYGMTAILSLYLNEKLGYSENEASSLYHGFTMMAYTMCVFGGIISDVWLGKFKTILYLSIVYAFGCFVISSSAVPNLQSHPKIVLIIGLILVAFGGGGIKPCVSAFGGDQFKLPEQAVQLASFFSLFYFSINCGSTISTTVTPILRANVHCFGESDCYSLAFGVPAVLMIVSIVLFLIGKSSYTKVEVSSENLMVQVSKCILNAITIKIREGHRSPRKNLLDYSIDKYGEELVNDIRTLLRILVLYLPLPMFWALQDQTGSRWTFQGRQMNGDIGLFIIQPDQMQMLNSLLVLIMIPLFEVVVYPILNRLGLGRPLQKMVIGCILTALSFVLAGIVQFQIEATPKSTVHILWQLPQYVVLTAGEVLFSPVGLGFSYAEAPLKMKSLVSAFWQLIVAFGNLITLIIVSSIHIFKFQSHEFLFFAGVMFVDTLIFSILAYFYKSSVRSEEEQIE